MRSDRANKERYHWTRLVQTNSNWELQLGAGGSAECPMVPPAGVRAWSCAWDGSFGVLPAPSCPQGAALALSVAMRWLREQDKGTAEPLPSSLDGCGAPRAPWALPGAGGTHWHQDAPLHPLLRARFPRQQMMMSEKSDDSCGRGRRKGSSHTAGSFLLTFGERNNSSFSWMGALLGPDRS